MIAEWPPVPVTSPQARQLLEWVMTRSDDDLVRLDDALASYGELLGLTDGTTDGLAVLQLMLVRKQGAPKLCPSCLRDERTACQARGRCR